MGLGRVKGGLGLGLVLGLGPIELFADMALFV